MTKRLTYEEVKEYIESFGYKLLSDIYINNYTKLKIKCPSGHEYEAVFKSFKNGNRCPYCHGKIKYKYEEVKEYIESFNYKLLSGDYKNSKEKLSLKCPSGHVFEMDYSHFKNHKHRCPICANERSGDSQRFTYEEVKEYIESFDYKLLSEEYVNRKTKLQLKCPLGHIYETTFGAFKSNQNRCPYCYGNIKHTFKEVKEYIENEGCKLLSTEYKNNFTKLKIMCKNEHIFEMNYAHFKNRSQRCPICSTSKGEQRIMNWLNENGINYIYDEPYFKDLLSPLGNPLRPDFIIEDKKVWIEYDGEFHFKKMYDDDNYDILIIHDEIKNQYAKKNRWRLIRIPYWEFDNIENILNKELNLK